MKDINGKELAVGQTVIVACKESGPNVPVLRKSKIVDIKEPEVSETGGWYGYIKLYNIESGRTSTIDGYLYMTNKRFCIID